MKKLISQGAEAKIFLDKNTILKARLPKGYRHQQLDKKIRTRRTKSEAKLLTKALEAGVKPLSVFPPFFAEILLIFSKLSGSVSSHSSMSTRGICRGI